MNYYTETIPLPLAEKLKEKGMPVEIVCDNTEEHSFPPEYHCETIIAEVLDWLNSHKIGIQITDETYCDEFGWHDDFLANVWERGASLHSEFYKHYDTWHEAANAAIEKALTLI